MNKLTISLSPHIHSTASINRCMWNVVIAMIPALGIALWTFGLPALWVVLLSVGTALLTEWAIERFLFHRQCTLSNGSALITGLLLAFNLPSITPTFTTSIYYLLRPDCWCVHCDGNGCGLFRY